MCLPPLHEENQIKPKWCLSSKHSCPTKPACKHAKTPDTHGGRAVIYCRPFDLMYLMSALLSKTAKSPLLLQRGAPRTHLGKDTTPNTPPSVPLQCWSPPHCWGDAIWYAWWIHTAPTTLGIPHNMSTVVSKQFDWYNAHFASFFRMSCHTNKAYHILVSTRLSLHIKQN